MGESVEGSATRWRGRAGRGWRSVTRDSVLVAVAAAAMTLSAFAVYQATMRSDEAHELLDQSRTLQSAAAREATFQQTVIGNDLRVLIEYCEAQVERDSSRATLLTAEPDIRSLVSSTLLMDAMQPLMQGDTLATCVGGAPSADTDVTAGYSVERAAQHLGEVRRNAVVSPTAIHELAAAAEVQDQKEQRLMLAALLCALTVAGIIVFTELQKGAPWPLRLAPRTARVVGAAVLVAGALACAAGLAISIADSWDWLAEYWYVLALVAVVVGGVVWLLVAADRRSGTDVRRSRRDRARPHWWAEIVGAAALVVFAAAAVALSAVSAEERDASSRADRQAAIAQTLEQVGQQSALADLAALSQYARVDAARVGAAQPATESGADADRLDALAAEITRQAQIIKQTMVNESRAELADRPEPACPGGVAVSTRPAADLYSELGSDRGAVTNHLVEQLRAARACDIAAAITRYVGRVWSGHQSMLTLALVVLGLAGFLLALAADHDRSKRSSVLLLTAGSLGILVGGMLGVPGVAALTTRAGLPDDAATRAFAMDVVNAAGACTPEAQDALSGAVESIAFYGPAYASRAENRSCTDPAYVWPQLSSWIDPDLAPEIRRDYETAHRLGPVTSSSEGNLGWMQILEGIQQDDDGLVRSGLAHTDAALQAYEESSGLPSATWLHYNRALATAALGDEAAAVRAYSQTTRCLQTAFGDPPPDCPPNTASFDREIEGETVLWALADLELLGEDARQDPYRLAIVRALADPDMEGDGRDAGLDVFPQEVQVSSTQVNAQVVWYFRPSHEVPWAVLRGPSLVTLTPGEHLNHPIPAEMLLEEGQYRADIYTGGTRLTRVDHDYAPRANLARYVSPRLGVSIVVPADWVEYRDTGVEWHLGPDSEDEAVGGLTVRRFDGVVPTGAVEDHLADTLHGWLSESGVDATSPPDELAQPWFAGLTTKLVEFRESQQSSAAVGLAPYASDASCGGAMFMARVDGSGLSPEDLDLITEIVIERPPERIPPHADFVEGDAFSIEIPAEWDAATQPRGGVGNLLMAKDCVGDANAILNEETTSQPVVDYVADVVASYEAGADPLPGFDLEADDPRVVAGAVDAREIVYTWIPPDREGPVRQHQVYASDGATMMFMTVTTAAADSAVYAEDIRTLVDTLAFR